MKNLPACKTCVNSGFLCTKCEEKLETGEITEFDIDLAKDFLMLEVQDEKHEYLKDVSFFKAIDFEDVVIFVVGKGDKIRITNDLINWFKKTYNIDKLILIEKTEKPRPVVEALIAPIKLLSLNEIFLATGEIEFKAVINEEDAEKMLFTREEVEELTQELTGKIVRVEFK